MRKVPITGAPKLYKKQAPVLTDQARTSAGAQRTINQGAQKFSNPYNEKNVPAPTQAISRANSNFAKDLNRYGAFGKSVSVKSRPTVDLSAVGEPRLPKGYNPVNSGFPVGAQRVVGGGTQPSAKWGPKAPTAKQRKEYPGIFGRGR